MAYNQKPETPLVNNGEFGDKIEKVPIKPAEKIEVESKEPELRTRKKSDAKKEGEHGFKYVTNPDEIIKFDDGTSTTKEKWVRSGGRKDYNKRVAKSAIGQAALGALGFFVGKNLNK
tara:strand:+ start:202 stop:552 length:351 start_codon:yes stop_codon:yes gene_type:complete